MANEPVTPRTLVGTALVLLSVFLILRPASSDSRSAPSAMRMPISWVRCFQVRCFVEQAISP